VKHRLFSGFVLAFVLMAQQATAESYLCIADDATGFAFDKNRRTWVHTSFDVSKNRYVVRTPDVSDDNTYKYAGVNKYSYILEEVGGEKILPLAVCENKKDQYGIIYCNGYVGGYFRVNTTLGRYIKNYGSGYWNDNVPVAGSVLPEGSDTPILEIGRCNRIS